MNKKVIETLIKIASKRQTILNKLAQELTDINSQISDFVKNNTTLWLANNGINAKYQFSFEESTDMGFDYNLQVIFTPAGQTGIANSPYMNIPAKYKEYIVGQLSKYPPLQNKKVKVVVHMAPVTN